MTDALHDWALNLAPGFYLGLWWLLVVLILAAVAGGVYFLKRARWIGDTPTSRIRSAHQGFVELEGIARQLDDHRVLKSPLSGTDCVWFDIRVEHYERDYGSDNNRSRWRTVVRQTSDQLIRLEDDTGACLIDPDGASCYPGFTRTWRGNTEMPMWRPGGKPVRRWLAGNYRYTERLLLKDAELYALGWFKTLSHDPQRDIEDQAAALLRQWKQDPQQMQRFDLDGNGRVDMHEWNWARRLARAQARAQMLQTSVAESEIHTLSAPPDGRPYILSGLPQRELIRRKRRYGFSLWAGSILLFGFWIYLTDLRGMPLPG